MRGMMAKIKPRLATNNIFTNILLSFLPIKYCFFTNLVTSFYICNQESTKDWQNK